MTDDSVEFFENEDTGGETEIANKTDNASGQFTPEIAGHSHVLGADSVIDPDMSHITTAAELFDYIEVFYQPGE